MKLQALGPSPEIRFAGRLDPVCASTEVHDVHVPEQDLVLGQRLLELTGEGCLVDLSLQCLVGDVSGGNDGLLYELLRDGRATLLDASTPNVGYEGTSDGAYIHTLVLVETFILDGEDRLLSKLRNSRERNHSSVLNTMEGGYQVAGPVVQLGRFGRLEFQVSLLQDGQIFKFGAGGDREPEHDDESQDYSGGRSGRHMCVLSLGPTALLVSSSALRSGRHAGHHVRRPGEFPL